MFKRLVSFLVIFCLFATSFVSTVFGDDEYKFLIDGEETELLNIIKKDDIYMISSENIKNIGVKVFKYANGRKAVFTANNISVVAEDGSDVIYINGISKTLETDSYIFGSDFFVPLDDVVKALGFQVKYSQEDKTANIYRASEIETAINSAEPIDGLYMSEELLANPNIEDNFTLDGSWSNRNGSTIEHVKERAQSGTCSALIKNRPTGWASITQMVNSKVSEYGQGKYRIRAYVTVKDEPCNMNVKLAVTDSMGVKHDYENVVPVSNTEWTLVDYVADVAWEGDVTRAEFYVEAPSNKGEAWERQEFYVDSCSLTKLMTYEEYEQVLTKRIEEKKAEEDRKNKEREQYNQLVDKYSEDQIVTYYPLENREILINPYKGLIIYPGVRDFSDYTGGGAGQIGSILYHRYSWCYIEPEEGVYNWEMFDKNIEICKKYGMQFGLGIGSTVNYNSTTSYNQDTPEWLFEAGCKYTVEDMGDGCVLKVPDYDDPIFREKMQNLIDAFSERYNNNQTIAYVDMRNYGNWGEWHFYQLPVNRAIDAKKTDEQFFEYIDMFKDMKLPTLSFVSKTAVMQHANERFGAGVRADGLVSPNESTQSKTMALLKDKAMAVGEWFEQYLNVYKPGGKYGYYHDSVPILYEKQVMEGYISSMAFLNWDADNAYKEWPDFYNRMANLLGYWYKPVKIEHSTDVAKGLFKMKVKNDGVAPLFAGYEKKAVVKLALADETGKILDTVVLDGVDPLYWSAGEYTDCVAEYEFKNTEGGKKLLLGVFTREENETPDVKLGIQADTVNGWYDISSMAKSDSENVAHNKLFKAKTLYADEGYGFRRPEYSCDNDNSTYWANNCAAGDYLEVDLGEVKDVSGVTLTSAENIKLKYSIQGFKNDKWVALASGISISSSGTVLKFRKAQVEKIRFVIEEDKDSVVKISEMNIK